MTERQIVLAIIDSWLRIDHDVLDIVVGVALGIYGPGEPIWLFLVDPPGGGKTEIIRAFRGHAKVHSEDKLTPIALSLDFVTMTLMTCFLSSMGCSWWSRTSP